MKRPPHRHPSQRAGRLDMRHDWLFQLVETVEPIKPEPLPVGEASFLTWYEFGRALRPAASSTTAAEPVCAADNERASHAPA